MRRLVWRLFPVVLSAIVMAQMVLGQSRLDDVGDKELATLLQRVGERVKKYYLDLHGLSWTDTVRQQPVKEDRTPQGNPRDLVYDMIIRLDPVIPRADVPPPLPPFHTKDLAELISIDGNPVQKGDSPGWTDPKAGDMGLLWILLWAPGRKDHSYGFSYAGRADLEGRKTLMVDITYSSGRGYSLGPFDVTKTGDPSRVPRAVWQGDSLMVWVQQTGRIWIDPDTYDVLRLETRTKPFEFEGPDGRGKLKFEFEMTARFQSMMFENPKQTLMVPASIESVRTIKGGQPPIVRTIHSFGNYKRFAGDIRITPLGDLPE